MYHTKRKKKNGNKILLVCFGVFAIVLGGYIYKTKSDTYSETVQNYKEVQEEVADVVVPEETNNKPKEEKVADYKTTFKSMKERNSDYVGWINVPGTKINYPVVQGKDNDFYLTHNFDKQKDIGGGVFVSYNVSSPFLGKNTVIHSHHMKNGTMFGTLKKYKDKKFLEQNPYVYITTETGQYKYKIFSVFVEEANKETYAVDFVDNLEFYKFANELKSKSAYDTGVAVSQDDKIIMLSTCSYEIENARLVVSAKLIK